MKLDQTQSSQLIKKIAKFSDPPKPCSLCGKSIWNISDTVFELREFTHGSMVVGGNSRIFPCITISCNNCGNTMLLNAIHLGIIEPNKSS